jgi:hypothetical protein
MTSITASGSRRCTGERMPSGFFPAQRRGQNGPSCARCLHSVTASLFSYNICVNSTVRAPPFPDVHGATARALAPDRATPWNFNEPLALCPGSQHLEREGKMAVNKPTGDNARKGAVKKRSQTKTTLGGASAWTKRNKGSGEFMALKRPGKTKRRRRRRNSKASG